MGLPKHSIYLAFGGATKKFGEHWHGCSATLPYRIGRARSWWRGALGPASFENLL